MGFYLYDRGGGSRKSCRRLCIDDYVQRALFYDCQSCDVIDRGSRFVQIFCAVGFVLWVCQVEQYEKFTRPRKYVNAYSAERINQRLVVFVWFADIVPRWCILHFLALDLGHFLSINSDH